MVLTSFAASRLPQSRRLRRPDASICDKSLHRTASRLPQSRRLRPEPNVGWISAIQNTASRLPQSRRLRLNFVVSGYVNDSCRLKIAAVAATAASNQAVSCRHGECLPPQDCRSRGDCGHNQQTESPWKEKPPQDCRSRGDCGSWPPTVDSRRLRAASRLPQSRRLRHIHRLRFVCPDIRPPQDCRSRGDCGVAPLHHVHRPASRLKIAAVAATAAIDANDYAGGPPSTASRLPQSRRLRRQA